MDKDRGSMAEAVVSTSSSSNPLPPSPPLPLPGASANADNDQKEVANDSNGPIASIDSSSLLAATQNLTGQALQFLSTASNETISACLVGLGATTYFVLGRVGLVLMGVVGGVVLHATWDGTVQSSISVELKAREEQRKKETGLDIIQRVYSWKDQQKKSSGEGEDGAIEKIELFHGVKLDFKEYPPETAAALTELTDATIRDYIRWWYSPILPVENSFPNSCRQTFTAFLLSISNHVSRKRPADTFIDFLTNSTSILIVFLDELSTAITSFPNSSTQEAIQDYLKMKPNSNLAQVMDEKHQLKKLDLVADDILETFLEHKAYNWEPARLFLREMLSKVVLEMTIQSCSRPEFINEWIVYLLEDAESVSGSSSESGAEGDTRALSDKDRKSGGTANTKASMSKGYEETASERKHKRVVSKAQEAMDDAMREAARLTQMIAEDEARRQGQQDDQSPSDQEPSSKAKSITTTGSNAALSSSVALTDDTESSNHGICTPTSSHSDLQQNAEELTPQTEFSQSRKCDGEEKRASEDSNKSAKFTNFDQLVPQQPPTALADAPSIAKPIPETLTLQKANVVIFDDSDLNDRVAIRSKPNTEYLIQVEPITSQYPGWMIVRHYADFESLHEVIGRLAKITDARFFAEAHSTIPSWRGSTKPKLREELERYLLDALRHRSLADSDGMKRFLEKDVAVSKVSTKAGFPGLGAIENVGKGVIDVLAKAPKDVADGGKAIIGGVSGVLSPKSQKKPTSPSPKPSLNRSSTSLSTASQSRPESALGGPTLARMSQDSGHTSSPIVDTQPAPIPQMLRRPSARPEVDLDTKHKPSVIPNSSWSSELAPIVGVDQVINLPPPPSDIPDDYDVTKTSPPRRVLSSEIELPQGRVSTSTTSSFADPKAPKKQPSPSKPNKPKPPITEQETQVAIELFFATITEVYKLSSAWSFRRALLNAAKAVLLRPGNMQLESIRQLLQDTVLDSNSSDSGIGLHLRKLRINSLPTEEELKEWPPELSPLKKEELRAKARKLLIERGMPQALMSVMGAAASGEAMGRVFDSLQVRGVSRGIVFGMMLQAIRAMTQ